MKILISLSGGLDSAVLLGLLKQDDNYVEAVSFYYGSKHNKYENESARLLANFYKIKLNEIDISSIMTGFKSNLLMSGNEIPEGHYQDSNMSKTVVPARNMIFISILAGLAISKNIPNIGLGVHSGDHIIYPDCRPEFIQSIEKTCQFASDGELKRIFTPFLNMSKDRIVDFGNSLTVPVPFELTRTCYKDQELACGICGSCVERLEAFEINEINDPIIYGNH